MDYSRTMWLSQEDLTFHRLMSFHRQRVESLLDGSPPLYKPESGFMVVHLIPEECLIGRSRFTGLELKTHGAKISALGQPVAKTSFNADGLVARYGSESIRAFSQLFRDGRLEAAMSGVKHERQGEFSIINPTICEQGVFWLVEAYLKFCKGIGIKPPIWLFATLANCNGARLPMNNRWMILSENTIDRSPAYLPEIEIKSLEIKVDQFLQPFCDSIWQATGVERSPSYDEEGNWHEPR